jgi:hypothetical protein
MRAAAVFLSAAIWAMGSTVAAALPPPGTPLTVDEDDDPKCARGECRPPRWRPLDEDDPKLARGMVRPRPVVRFELSYRFLMVADPYEGSLPFHLFEIGGYPYARIFRVGFSLTAGGAARHSAWLADLGLSVGVQYPARVTPFLDVRFAAGAIGAEIVGRKVVSYQYRPVVEGGIQVFLARAFHLTAAIGYAHPVYGGVDAKAIEQAIARGETPKYEVKDIGYDTVTARVGLGF